MSTNKQIEVSSFSEDALEFMQLLGKHQVCYVIAGGEAVIFHGYPRYTGDIDFFYERTEANAARLFEALVEFWKGPVPGVRNAGDLMEEAQIVQFGRPPHRIDLLNSIDGVDFSEAWDSREIIHVSGAIEPMIVYYLSKAALVKNKKASGRPRDMDDVQHLNELPEV